MNTVRVVLAAVVALLSLPVGATTPEVAGGNWPAGVKAVAGEAVRSFRFGHLRSADALNDRQLLVRVWPQRSWLLTVDHDCDLSRAISQFALTSALGTVRVNRDRVVFASEQTHGACRVRQIHPVDLRDMVASDR